MATARSEDPQASVVSTYERGVGSQQQVADPAHPTAHPLQRGSSDPQTPTAV